MNDEPAAAPHPPLIPGSFGRRAVAYTVDLMLLQIGYLVLLAIGVFGVSAGTGHAGTDDSWSWLLNPQLASVYILLWIGTYVLYFTFFHVVGGQTPAKRLVCLKVVSMDGEPLSVRQALLRTVGYFFSSGFLGFGFLMAVLHPRRRALHDLLSGTIVVVAPPPTTVLSRRYG